MLLESENKQLFHSVAKGFMYYTIYKTTNNINGKYYIGKHKTSNLDDMYMGSGKILKHAIKKHGIDNFIKEYLFIFDNEEDMNNKEAELVSKEFVKEDTNYNLNIGGKGSWSFANSLEISLETRKKISDSLRINYENGLPTSFQGKKHTEEFKEHIGKINSIKQKGSNNSQYGMMWIYSLEEKISKRISKNEIIPEGWYKGRKMSF